MTTVINVHQEYQLSKKRKKYREEKHPREMRTKAIESEEVWNALVPWCEGWVLDISTVDSHRIVIVDYSKKVKIFDSHTKAWHLLPCLPRDLDGRLSSVVLNGFLYVLVGDESHSTTWRMNIAQPDEWEEIMQTGSQRTDCAITSDDKYIYASGGYYQEDSCCRSQNPLDNFARFDPKTSLWQNLPPMQYKRKYHTSARVGNKIYIIGGRSYQNIDLSTSVEAFDTIAQTWSHIPNMPVQFFSKLSSVVLNDRWIIVVGARIDGVSSCVIFDTKTQTWFRAIDLALTICCDKVLLVNGSQIAISGQNNDSFFTIKSIDFQYLNPWFSVGHMIMLRRLVEKKRAVVRNEANNTEHAIQTFVSDSNDNIFKRVLSFLIYHPESKKTWD